MVGFEISPSPPLPAPCARCVPVAPPSGARRLGWEELDKGERYGFAVGDDGMGATWFLRATPPSKGVVSMAES